MNRDGRLSTIAALCEAINILSELVEYLYTELLRADVEEAIKNQIIKKKERADEAVNRAESGLKSER